MSEYRSSFYGRFSSGSAEHFILPLSSCLWILCLLGATRASPAPKHLGVLLSQMEDHLDDSPVSCGQVKPLTVSTRQCVLLQSPTSRTYLCNLLKKASICVLQDKQTSSSGVEIDWSGSKRSPISVPCSILKEETTPRIVFVMLHGVSRLPGHSANPREQKWPEWPVLNDPRAYFYIPQDPRHWFSFRKWYSQQGCKILAYKSH